MEYSQTPLTRHLSLASNRYSSASAGRLPKIRTPASPLSSGNSVEKLAKPRRRFLKKSLSYRARLQWHILTKMSIEIAAARNHESKCLPTGGKLSSDWMRVRCRYCSCLRIRGLITLLAVIKAVSYPTFKTHSKNGDSY
jgi:hypothetical protein